MPLTQTNKNKPLLDPSVGRKWICDQDGKCFLKFCVYVMCSHTHLSLGYSVSEVNEKTAKISDLVLIF